MSTKPGSGGRALKLRTVVIKRVRPAIQQLVKTRWCDSSLENALVRIQLEKTRSRLPDNGTDKIRFHYADQQMCLKENLTIEP